jgi:hypothetical protein
MCNENEVDTAMATATMVVMVTTAIMAIMGRKGRKKKTNKRYILESVVTLEVL